MLEKIKLCLRRKVVGIAGCGGLGSNCAISLARSGIGKLIIADFDTVVENNLSRQYYFYNQIGQKKVFALRDNLIKVNTEIEVDAYDIKLDRGSIINIYKDCDVIIEALDLAEMKKMLIETVLMEFSEKPIISGVGIAGWGNNNSIKTHQYGNLYICGDGVNEVSEDNPPLAPKVGVIANMQANMALEILLKNEF